MKRIQGHLENRPTEWGDPDFNLVHEGAAVYHGVEPPFVVRFAVYTKEMVVCVIEINALPSSQLAES
jgi:hypothetical protein